MDRSVRRALGFAAVATLVLATPLVGPLVAVPFALIAVGGRTVSDGPVFDVFASSTDRRQGELRGLVGFALAATALALLSTLTRMPDAVVVVTVLVLGYGNLGEQVARIRRDRPIDRVLGFVVVGGLAAGAGQWLSVAFTAGTLPVVTAGLLAVIGALLAALLRATFLRHEDPAVVVPVGIGLWVLAALPVSVDPAGLAIAVAVAGGFGLLSWVVGTASVTGMLTGVIITTLTIVLGGYGWFAVLLAFFGTGGLASKYRYEEKRASGVAEGNEGARGGRNVLGNAAVALVAVIGFAAASGPVVPRLFLFAFVGSLATAMSDTLSSEVGVLFGPPRLVTTLEPVEPGTDGGVTLAGSLAGAGGAAVIAAVAVALLGAGPAGAGVVVGAGVAGMLADSVLGATVEGRWIGNEAVNFLATLVGALVCVAGVGALGLVP